MLYSGYLKTVCIWNFVQQDYAGGDIKWNWNISKSNWNQVLKIIWYSLAEHNYSRWILNRLFSHYVSMYCTSMILYMNILLKTYMATWILSDQWSPFHAQVGHGHVRCPAGFLQFESLWWGDFGVSLHHWTTKLLSILPTSPQTCSGTGLQYQYAQKSHVEYLGWQSIVDGQNFCR